MLSLKNLSFLDVGSLVYVKKPTSHLLNKIFCLFFSTKTVLFLIFFDFSEVFQKCIGLKKAQLGKAEVISCLSWMQKRKEKETKKQANVEIRLLLAGPTRCGTTSVPGAAWLTDSLLSRTHGEGEGRMLSLQLSTALCWKWVSSFETFRNFHSVCHGLQLGHPHCPSPNQPFCPWAYINSFLEKGQFSTCCCCYPKGEWTLGT